MAEANKRKIDQPQVALPLLVVLVVLPLMRVASHEIRTVDFLQLFTSGMIAGALLRGMITAWRRAKA